MSKLSGLFTRDVTEAPAGGAASRCAAKGNLLHVCIDDALAPALHGDPRLRGPLPQAEQNRWTVG